jgi:aspartate 1-decarboxylase
MNRFLLKSKIHGAVVTEANLEYEGSLTVDKALLGAANIVEYERVVIWNLSNGSRIETYAIEGERESGVVCANGAAAHHIKKGDKIIIATFATYSPDEIGSYKPIKVFVDNKNRIKKA